MTTRRRWTDETIAAELAPIVAELGRMPKRDELAERGLSGLWSALQRNGGVSSWKERMTAGDAGGGGDSSRDDGAGSGDTSRDDGAGGGGDTSRDDGAGDASRDDIARRAYEISLERGGEDHVGNWLAAEQELSG